MLTKNLASYNLMSDTDENPIKSSEHLTKISFDHHSENSKIRYSNNYIIVSKNKTNLDSKFSKTLLDSKLLKDFPERKKGPKTMISNHKIQQMQPKIHADKEELKVDIEYDSCGISNDINEWESLSTQVPALDTILCSQKSQNIKYNANIINDLASKNQALFNNNYNNTIFYTQKK